MQKPLTFFQQKIMEKNVRSFAVQKLLAFFQQKNNNTLDCTVTLRLNKSLTKD